jgi:hypothetical protein
MPPAHPTRDWILQQLLELDKPKDPNFCSIRVNLDVRLIVHRTGGNLLLCYVAHHDDAYQWAQRRKLEFERRIRELDGAEKAAQVDGQQTLCARLHQDVLLDGREEAAMVTLSE